MNEEPYVGPEVVTPGVPRVRRACWGAIFAGAFVSVVIQMMFMLLGAAIGFAIIKPSQGSNSAQGLATGSAIWLLVTGLISTWTGACVAGRLSGGPRRADGMLHGIVTWSVSVVALFLLLATTAGAVLSGAGALFGGAVRSGAAVAQSQSGQGVQNTVAAAEDSIKQMFPQAGSLLPPTGRTEDQQVPGQLTDLAAKDPQLMAALTRMEKYGGASQDQADRQQVINLLTTKNNMSQEDAQNLVNQWDQQFQQLRAKTSKTVNETAQAASKGISTGAFWGFIALLLGLCVSAWGGWAGTASLRRIETPVPAA